MLENLIPITGLTGVSVSTSTAWEATNVVVPAGVYLYESDTGKAKIANGTDLYSALPFHVDSAFTPAFKTLLEQAGQPEGVAVLNTSGVIPASNLPVDISNKPVFVATIADRDAIPQEDRDSIVIVTDASGDSNVTMGMASYFWNTVTNAWIKISEAESMDMDFSQFVESGDAIDLLADTAQFVKMTPAERTRLSNAMLKTEQFQITNLGAAAFTTTGP